MGKAKLYQSPSLGGGAALAELLGASRNARAALPPPQPPSCTRWQPTKCSQMVSFPFFCPFSLLLPRWGGERAPEEQQFLREGGSSGCKRGLQTRAANEGTFICIPARTPRAHANEGPRSAGERAQTRAPGDLPLLLVSFLSPIFVLFGGCEARGAAVWML